jgi:hypothetical protein
MNTISRSQINSKTLKGFSVVLTMQTIKIRLNNCSGAFWVSSNGGTVLDFTSFDEVFSFMSEFGTFKELHPLPRKALNWAYVNYEKV